ncbi:hypothetical protein [Eleftheria terrae]|uniref:hypothetical protein n=1 Tax=Eleftheria terrae TaxID=1597781 RepID=UPI00263B271F|nr:hypothetical protein [Eleftheria terrae]
MPLTIRRRHIRKVLTLPTGQDAPASLATLDVSMIKVLGKAFYWQRLMEEGGAVSTKDLARLLKLDAGWVAEALRLTLLAPDIVEAILEGKQPRYLNLHMIRGREDLLPQNWQEQRRLLGFPCDVP